MQHVGREPDPGQQLPPKNPSALPQQRKLLVHLAVLEGQPQAGVAKRTELAEVETAILNAVARGGAAATTRKRTTTSPRRCQAQATQRGAESCSAWRMQISLFIVT